MSVRTHYKLIGAAGAAALALSVAGPALAAGEETASVAYTCTTALGDAHPSAVYHVNAPAAKMAAGQPVTTTATFSLDAATTGLAAAGLGWTSFNGTIASKPTATLAGLKLKIAKTTLGNGAGGSTDSAATGSTLSGTKVGAFTYKLGNLGLVTLNGFDATGKKLGTVTFPGSFGQCINDAGTTTLQNATPAPATTTIVKDTTKTTEKVKYAAKKKTATGTAHVKSRFGIAPTGKVTFVLKKGAKTVKSAKGAINKKGVATASFKKVSAKGKYSIVAKYAGSANLKGSTGKASFTVK